MSLAVNALKTIARRASVMAMVKYDQLRENLLPLIAQIVPPNGRQKIQTVEWFDAFPLMREWIGERQVDTILQASIEAEVKPFEKTFKLDRMDLELDGEFALVRAPEDLAEQFERAFGVGRVLQAFSPLRNNTVTTYDGQNIFDTDHTHPDGVTFSNVLDLSVLGAARAASGAPTALEARAELKLAIDQLVKQRLRQQTIRETPAEMPLVVVVKSFGVWSGYYDLLTQDVINNTTNTWKGKFRLLIDDAPVSGDEAKVDVINAEPGGARPTIFIPVREPRGIELDETMNFKHREILFGSDALYAFAAGLPQSAVRIQE